MIKLPIKNGSFRRAMAKLQGNANVMINFTNQMHPRIGVIDWGLAVRVQYESKKSWVANPTIHALRQWLAPELLNRNHFYTRATDIWSVAWLIIKFITFCEEFCKLHYPDWNQSLQQQMQSISNMLSQKNIILLMNMREEFTRFR
ncbi:hypothetical protein O6H91_06G137000 [Diphasiastrum complanatum]|uniref:Uncharacterized protein n=1 Tax=Diphasiastrum complanatum TaxID=34168 RepID=A0ACC2DJP3_DIPCM|nr:hypothetical protein O6H91_06G137000 [Diphasiastrum complanatum]